MNQKARSPDLAPGLRVAASRSIAIARQGIGFTACACRPLGPLVTSKLTFCPSASERNPSAWMALWWQKTSSPPLSCVMKPRPFASPARPARGTSSDSRERSHGAACSPVGDADTLAREPLGWCRRLLRLRPRGRGTFTTRARPTLPRLFAIAEPRRAKMIREREGRSHSSNSTGPATRHALSRSPAGRRR
jgi:hypothetical protein